MRFPTSFRPFIFAAVPTATVLLLAAAPQFAHAQFNISTQTYGGINLSQTGPLNGGNYAPPDTMGSVGFSDVVEFINGGFQVFNKSDGTARTTLTTDTSFWINKAGLSAAVVNVGLSDTRLIFDQATSRWFAAEINVASTANQILLARSDTSDPTGTWKGTNFTAPSGFADYPTLSLDANALYIGTNNFTSDVGSFTGVSLVSIPKSDILLGTPTVANRAVTTDANGTNRGFTLQGVLDFGPSTQGTVIARSNTDNTTLRVTKVNNPGAAGATFANAFSLATTGAPASLNYAPQPDGTTQLDNGENRISGQVVKAGNYIYLTQAVGVGARSGIKLTILNAAGTAVVAQQTFSDVPNNRDYYYPSISANANGTFVIGFTRSGLGAGDFAGSFARVGSFNGTTITLNGTDTLLRAGLANYHLFGGVGERWGDYSATVLDPTDANSFWTFQEYAQSPTVWATTFSKVTVTPTASGAPEPASLVLCGMGVMPLVGAIVQRRRRTRKA